MWIEKEITIEGKKVTANVNESENDVEIEVMYGKAFGRAQSLVIDGKTYSISIITDQGNRQETLQIICKGNKKNEHKQVKSGKDIKLPK
mgnify:CR=1 FL=1